MAIPEKYAPYMHYLPTAALFLGLIFDIFTLDRPDALFENVVIAGYLTLSAIVMVLLQARADGGSENKRLLMLGILQFSFGNLASALMVLYSRSGTFAGSAIFIGILALLFLGNELLRNRYARTHLRVIIWFLLFLTYSTIFVPVVLNGIGALIFLVSVALALAVTAVLVFVLSRVTRNSFEKRSRRITTSIIILSIAFSGLYFANLIPPVPLALKHIGIYHEVNRLDGMYTVTFEPPKWYAFWRDTNGVFHQQNNAPAYCFTSVFAPGNLKTEIRHRWEKYDPKTDEWVTVARIPFPILGGRETGFRGYTQTSQIDEGRWRCSAETARGNLIGREEFVVQPSAEIPHLQTISL